MSLTQLGLSFSGYRKLSSPTHVQKAHLRVAVHVVPCPISGDPLLVHMSARGLVSARVGIPP
eukprot:4589401-Lingulodinium_polyedra.AAC.1